jgi:hypothetical protein
MARLEDLRDERKHMEGLLNQRFYFFIIIFGFIVTATPKAINVAQLRLILIIGFCIELLFTLLIGRAQRRLKINMDLLANEKDISDEIKSIANIGFFCNPFKRSVVYLMGYYIPILISVLLLISIFFSSTIYYFFK